MTRLSKEKRQQLILVIMLTAGTLAGVWFGLISSQMLNLKGLAGRKVAAEQLLQQMKQAIEKADQLEAQLDERGKELAELEGNMASGDLYAWAINTLRESKLNHKVEIPQFSQVDGPKDVPMLPRFPYKQIALTIGGAAGFYDLGRFIADLENRLPYARVSNLSLDPGSTLPGANREALSFRMEISALVKPGSS